MTPAQRADHCIDWRRQRSVLEAVAQGREATWHAYDWEADDGRLSDRSRTCRPARVVILDGAYSARPELAGLLDLRVLLDVPDEVHREQLRQREGEHYRQEWEARWASAEDAYFTSRMPPEAFDLVIRPNVSERQGPLVPPSTEPRPIHEDAVEVAADCDRRPRRRRPLQGALRPRPRTYRAAPPRRPPPPLRHRMLHTRAGGPPGQRLGRNLHGSHHRRRTPHRAVLLLRGTTAHPGRLTRQSRRLPVACAERSRRHRCRGRVLGRECTRCVVSDSQSWPIKPKERHRPLQPDKSRGFSRALSCPFGCSTGSLGLQEKPKITDPNAANQTHRSGRSGMRTAADWNGRMYQTRPSPPLHGSGCHT